MALLLLALGVLCIAALLRKIGSREAGLPPGPPTLPIVGNLHLLPTEFVHYKCVRLVGFDSDSPLMISIDSQNGHGNTAVFIR
jgi:hypothetical protein